MKAKNSESGHPHDGGVGTVQLATSCIQQLYFSSNTVFLLEQQLQNRLKNLNQLKHIMISALILCADVGFWAGGGFWSRRPVLPVFTGPVRQGPELSQTQHRQEVPAEACRPS